MAAAAPLSFAQKEFLIAAKQRGQTFPAIAAILGCRPITVRKWWRRNRDQGRQGLLRPRRAPPRTGPCARCAPRVVQTALALKQAHPRWGPDRVRVALAGDPALVGLPLPSRSRLAVLFALHRPPPAPAP